MPKNNEKKDGGIILPDEDVERTRREEVGAQEEANLEELQIPGLHELYQTEDSLKKAKQDLKKAYGGEAMKTEEREAEKTIKEAEKELTDMLNRKKESSGRELSDDKIYSLTKDFYLNKLGYEVKYSGISSILRNKARIWNKKEKTYVPDDQIGKPVEFKNFKKGSFPQGETPFIKFLKEKYEKTVKDSLTEGSAEQRQAGEQGQAEETEKEAERLMQEKREELYGKSISDPEVYYDVTRNFYFKKLGYKPKSKGPLGGKARIWDLKTGEYVKDENGKPVEFETKFSPRGETPILKFLEEKYKNEFIIKDLQKKYQEKTEDAQKLQQLQEIVGATFEEDKARGAETQKNIQGDPTEKAESEKKPLTQTEFFSRYLRANDLDETDITPEKLQELERSWKAYRKEMRIKPPQAQAPEAKAPGETASKSEQVTGEAKEKQVSPSTIKKLINFFERIKDDQRIKKALEGLAAGKVDSAEKELSRMLENSKRNLRLEEIRERKNPGLIKQRETHIKKLEDFLQEIRSPVEDADLPLRGEGFVASKPFLSETPHEKGIEFRPGETSAEAEEEKRLEEEIKQKVGDIIGIIKQVSRSRETTDGQLSGANERRAEKSPEIEEDKASLISSASSFEELSRVIGRIGIIKGSRGGKYSPEKIILDIKDIEEDLIYLIRQGKISPDSPEIEKSLRKFTRSYGLREKIIELIKAETAKVELEKKPPVEQGPEASLDSGRKELDEEELAEERAARQLIKRNKRKKESNKKEKKIGFMERAKVLIENGSFNFKITPELKKFFKDRGYNQEQIRKISKDSKAAWREASDIYQKEQKGVAEE